MSHARMLSKSLTRIVSISLLIGASVALSGCQTQIITPAPVTTTSANDSFNSVDSFNAMDGNTLQAALTPLFNRARSAVQLETRSDLSHVSFAVVPNREIEREVAAETGRLTHSQFPDNQFADNFLTNIMEGQAGTYAARYSTTTQQVMVSDSLLRSYVNSVGNDALAIKHALNALLIHELVHAADDSRYGINRNRHLNFRASFAQSAVYEGHAQYVTRRICQRAGCSQGLNSLDQFMFGDQTQPNQLTQPVQAVLVSSALDSPPIDPIQILDPLSFPNQTRKRLNQRLLEASSGIQHRWVTNPWIRVETSPLKGVNLRADPARRTAAVDGFTRLIRGMVALQHYDQSAFNRSPIEVTLMAAEGTQTADMFAQSLSNNLVFNSGGEAVQSTVWLNEEIPVAVISVNTELDDGSDHMALVVSHGDYVLQLVGVDIRKSEAFDYAAAVLTNLAFSTNDI